MYTFNGLPIECTHSIGNPHSIQHIYIFNLTRVPILDAIHEIGDHFHAVYDTNLTWDDIKWLQENSPLPLIVKGILTGWF